MNGLKQRTFHGAMHVGGATLASRVLSVVSGIILARLLEPVEFGLVSLCYIVLSVVSLLAPLGISTALIRYKGENPDKASFQVFVGVTTTGTVFFLLVLLFTDQLAILLGNPAVSMILPWMALLILIDMVGRAPEALLERNLEFKAMSRIQIASEFSFVVVSIGLALGGRGVWSLVSGHLSRALVATILSIVWHKGREWLTPKRWDWQIHKDLMKFGIRSVASNAVNRFYLNVDNFVVGTELGATDLGYYTKAFSFTTANVDNVTRTIGRVLFPTYAKIQDDPVRLSQAYLKSLSMISSVTIPVATGIAITAPELIPALLGQKWTPMVPILQVLALMSVVKPVSATAGSVFNALGLPGRNITAGLVVSAVMVAGMFLLLDLGTVGVAWAVVSAHVAGYLFNIFQMRRVLPEAAAGMIPTVLPAFAASTVTGVCMYATGMFLPESQTDEGRLAVFAAMTVTGLLVYGAYLVLFQRPMVKEIRALLRPAQ